MPAYKTSKVMMPGLDWRALLGPLLLGLRMLHCVGMMHTRVSLPCYGGATFFSAYLPYAGVKGWQRGRCHSRPHLKGSFHVSENSRDCLPCDVHMFLRR
jgi:hypothetical protein